MAKRYIGDATVTVTWDDRAASYKGTVSAHGKTWRFAGLGIGKGWNLAVDSVKAYDRAAEAAVGFGSYYTTGNRGDVGEGYPSAAVADAISEATVFAQDDRGEYEVRRSKHGRAIKVRNNPVRRRRSRR